EDGDLLGSRIFLQGTPIIVRAIVVDRDRAIELRCVVHSKERTQHQLHIGGSVVIDRNGYDFGCGAHGASSCRRRWINSPMQTQAWRRGRGRWGRGGCRWHSE